LIDRALRSRSTDPFANLALEESLLERGFGGGSVLLLYVNAPCAVVGRNQNPWAEVSAEAALGPGPGRGEGMPVLRRVSGGGAVYQDLGNLDWSLILPRSRHDREAELALVAGALRELGMELAPGPRGGLFIAGQGPLAGSKVSGTARRLQAERVLHHGTLLVDSELPLLRSALGGMKVEASKALSSVSSPCANLSSLATGLGLEDAASALARALVGREPESAEGVADPLYAADAAIRLRSWDWTWGATPAFAIGLGPSGGGARIEVRGGRVASASGPGSELLGGFIGRAFDYGTPGECVNTLEGSDV
jgi:lipoate---protein ligase